MIGSKDLNDKIEEYKKYSRKAYFLRNEIEGEILPVFNKWIRRFYGNLHVYSFNIEGDLITGEDSYQGCCETEYLEMPINAIYDYEKEVSKEEKRREDYKKKKDEKCKKEYEERERKEFERLNKKFNDK